MWIKPLGLAGNNSIKHENIHITGCTFTHTGGSGFVPNRSRHVVVEHCLFNHTGSSIDDRMWARGSGTWPFKCERVVIQHNRLMNAHGSQDSYSAHIDYGCKDVVIQYNLSFNNEGGFAEILGDNINCGYRYNISVNDGHREDPDGQPWNKKGKIFWLSTFCGNNQVRCPSQGSFFYNNTVYVDESINPEIYMWPDAGDVLICNNLVSMAAGGEVLPTLLEDEGNVFNVSHNLFHPPARIDLDNDLLTNALFLSPQFLATSDTPVQSELNYQPSPASPALSNGVLIFGSDDPWDFLHNNGGQDFLACHFPTQLPRPSVPCKAVCAPKALLEHHHKSVRNPTGTVSRRFGWRWHSKRVRLADAPDGLPDNMLNAKTGHPKATRLSRLIKRLTHSHS